MNTLSAIDDVFADIVSSHVQLKSIQKHSFDEVDMDKVTLEEYPLLYAQVTSSTVDTGFVEFDYELVVADLVMERQHDTIQDVLNETHMIMQDVLAHLINSVHSLSDSNEEWVTVTPFTCSPFFARFSNMLTGWSTTVTIRTPQNSNLCDVPQD